MKMRLFVLSLIVGMLGLVTGCSSDKKDEPEKKPDKSHFGTRDAPTKDKPTTDKVGGGGGGMVPDKGAIPD